MEIRVLEYFVTAARLGNITRAAEKLYVSQPALSAQFKSLEEELGCKLFKKISSGIQLTAEGMLFLQRASNILEMVSKTRNEFASLDGNPVGDIHIGCAESASFKYVAEVAKIIQRRYPNIRYHIHSGNSEDLSYRLEKDLLDFYFTIQRVDLEVYNCLKIPAVETWGVIMRSEDILAQKNSVSVEDLTGLPLIMSREAMSEEYPAWFCDRLDKLNIAVTFNLVYNAAVMVRAGLGYLVSIGGIVDAADLTFRPLSPSLIRDVYFIWKRNNFLSAAAEIFLREMKNRYA